MEDKIQKTVGLKKKTIFMVALITLTILGIAILILLKVFSSPDPNVAKYHEAMKQLSLSNEGHAIEELYINGELKSTTEYYQADSDECSVYAIEGTDEIYTHLIYDEWFYSCDEREVMKTRGVSTYFPNRNTTYFLIFDNVVTYEENENGYSFHVENPSQRGESPISYNNWDATVTSAAMECYFDKEWNMRKLVIKESFELEENGKIQEMSAEIIVTFQKTTQEEIREMLDAKYKELINKM